MELNERNKIARVGAYARNLVHVFEQLRGRHFFHFILKDSTDSLEASILPRASGDLKNAHSTQCVPLRIYELTFLELALHEQHGLHDDVSEVAPCQLGYCLIAF